MMDYWQYKTVHYWANVVRNKQAFCMSADFFKTAEVVLPREHPRGFAHSGAKLARCGRARRDRSVVRSGALSAPGGRNLRPERAPQSSRPDPPAGGGRGVL